jgi:hypothetical protein
MPSPQGELQDPHSSTIKLKNIKIPSNTQKK